MKKPRRPARPRAPSKPAAVNTEVGGQATATFQQPNLGSGVAVHQATFGLNVHQSPFPPAAEIEAYERLNPGSFGRIIAMAERAQQAQIEATQRAQKYASDDTRRGQWLGFTTAMAAMIGSGVVAHFGNPWVAGLFLSIPVLAVAKALIESASGRRKA